MIVYKNNNEKKKTRIKMYKISQCDKMSSDRTGE